MKRALRRFDQPMNMIEAFGLGEAKALEQRQYDERRQTLSRRRRAKDRARLKFHGERLGQSCIKARKVIARDRAADPLEIDRDLAPDIAAVEIGQPRVREVI